MLASLLLATPSTAVGHRGASPEFLRRAFGCIHRHEGSWKDPGPTYFGGLQMDRGFQQTYGREFYEMWGTANYWPPYVQLTVGMRAYRTRGFSPWPNTARMCGLL